MRHGLRTVRMKRATGRRRVSRWMIRLTFHLLVTLSLSFSPSFPFLSCGIVLCSRDAKFAVDCDTCRLSYCLVCLASGSKDPCVRCGHRPSKRMEQLVHLRLKSIYKAFKSSSNSKNKSDGGDGKSTPSNATMASVAAANAKQQQQQNAQASSSSSHHVRCSQHSSYHGPRRCKPTTLQDMVGDDDEELDGDDDDNDNMMMMGNVLPAKFCHDLEQNFLAEQKKADAAAEALLAELEEEEEANAKKKSKKKKKKERKQAKKGADDTKSSPEDDDEKQREISKEDDDTEKEMSDVESNEQDTSPVEGPPQEMDEEDEDAVKMDPIEKELMEYVDSGYAEGIEDILFRLKGIPGKAVLRKNAKKSLKRLRAEMELIMENSEADFEPVPESKSRQSAISSPPKAAAVAKSSTTPNKSAHRQSVQSTTASANKNETFVPIASTLVGWVIGKGGQRIRDMMEASGAKIWVDQEKVKGQPTRNVFISGDKDCVEQGVRLVKDVIANAPPPPGSAPSPTTAVNTAAAAAPNLSAAVEGGDLKAATKQAWESAENAGVAGARMVDSQPRRPSTPGNDGGSGIMTEVVSCETRFVPLLIGKRGWTIKNIQDESGARVDIDQTVTPRQVRISGSRANVEKAVNMVRDVLSYPHAQLQHGSEELELINHADDAPAVPVSPLKAEVEPSSPTKEQLLAASARLEKDATRKEPESPPPVVGDARSAISASSSLSSTPEPSMASSAKGALASQQLQAQLSGGPLIPPAPQQFSASSTNLSTSVPTFFHQSEMTLKNIRNSEVFGETSGPASTQLYETILSGPLGGMSGRIGVTQGSLPEVAHRQSSHLQPLQDIYASSAPKSVPNQMNPGILPPHQRHYQQPQQPSDQAPSNYGPSGHIPRQMPSQVGGSSQYDYNSGMAQNLRGYPSTTGRSLHSSYSNEAANLIATTPLRDLMGHSMNRGLPSASSAMRSSIYRGNLGSGGAMWNSSNSSYPSGSGGNGGNLRSTGSGLHRAPPPAPSPGYHQSRSAGYSSHQHQLQHQHSHDSGLSGGIGYGSTRSHQSYQQQHTSQLPYSNTRGGLGGGNLHGSPAFPSAPAARSSSLPPPTDDSRMLETLFGTVASAGASNDAGSLLAGLNSLSLGGDTGGETSTGLWGPSSLTDSWTPNAAAGEKQSSSGPSSLGDILSGPLPSLQLDQSQESRFQWK